MIERRRRVRCRLQCELLGAQPNRRRSSIVTLSEGGFALETSLPIDPGQPIRLCILPHRREQSVELTGIVWNDRAAHRGGAPLRVLGCVVSDPPPGFLALFDEVDRREAAQTQEMLISRPQRTRKQTPLSQPPSPKAPRTDAAELLRWREEPERPPSRKEPEPSRSREEPELPRSREPLPPPKPEPVETLPRFRVRLRQVGGSRTRTFDVRAHSMARAAERAQAELAGSRVRWKLLEVIPGGSAAKPRRS